MNFDSVLLLPLLAAALAVFYKVFKKHPYYSKSIKSRKHRKLFLVRIAIIVLVLAAAASYLFTLQGMSKLATASILSMVFLIPAYLVYLYMNRRYAKSSTANSTVHISDSDNATESADESNNVASVPVEEKQTEHVVPDISLTKDIPPREAKKASVSASHTTAPHTAIPSLFTKERSPSNDEPPTVEGSDSPAEVQDQLDRVSDHIESHDLGNSDYSLSDDDLERRRFSLKSDVPLAIESALATVDTNANELSKMSSNEISELVTTLRTDKTKLQKLVIAQQASIDSERKAHDQSRTVARDAIKIMRDARNGQKLAEKMARRERSERKRVAQEYKKVTNALNNALSIIEARKVEETEI